MLGIFKKKTVSKSIVEVDLHSHLLPDLDDGVENFEESLEILGQFQSLGYKKVITTPHVMTDMYNNSNEEILEKHEQLLDRVRQKGLTIQVEVAAEYYLDETLMKRIEDPSSEFLLLDNRYMLFETAFMNRPFYLEDFIFKAMSRGLKLILAHPERYAYIQSDVAVAEELVNRGVHLQLNLPSLAGYYSKMGKKTARKLIDQKLIHFVGSDCHTPMHMQALKDALGDKYCEKLKECNLLNNQLI